MYLNVFFLKLWFVNHVALVNLPWGNVIVLEAACILKMSLKQCITTGSYLNCVCEKKVNHQFIPLFLQLVQTEHCRTTPLSLTEIFHISCQLLTKAKNVVVRKWNLSLYLCKTTPDVARWGGGGGGGGTFPDVSPGKTKKKMKP